MQSGTSECPVKMFTVPVSLGVNSNKRTSHSRLPQKIVEFMAAYTTDEKVRGDIALQTD